MKDRVTFLGGNLPYLGKKGNM